MTTVAPTTELNVALGSIFEVRDEEWLVKSAERGSDGWLLQVQGLSELFAGTSADFYSLDEIAVVDPAEATVVADGSSGYRDPRLGLEAIIGKTLVPSGDQTLTVSTRVLTDPLACQRTAVVKALSPQPIRTQKSFIELGLDLQGEARASL